MDRASEIRRAEKNIAEFFDSAPIGTVITARDGSWERVNATLASMLGYSVDELKATPFLSLTHPDDVEESQRAMHEWVTGGRPNHVAEKRCRAKDGSYLWVHATTTFHHDTHGGAQLLTYVVDVATTKRADAVLKASETRYRRLFESAKDGIMILDAGTGRIVEVNPFMTELTGYSRNEYLGRHLWEIGPFKDSAASKISFAELQANDYVRYDDLPLKTEDGREVAVEFVSNVYLVDEERVIQCNVRDVTERRQTERELRIRDRAIQAVSQGILITDAESPDNPIVYASPGFEQMSGYSSAEVVGKNCRFMRGPATDAMATTKLRDAIRDGQGCTVELLNLRKDGTPFWNLLTLSPVSDAKGLTNFVGVLTDVTERRQLESQLLQAQKMEAVGRLAGGIAHDFNNALSVILSYAEIILRDLQADDPLRVDIQEIQVAALRAADMTRQLLAFSRQQVLEVKVVDLNEKLKGMARMLGRLLGAGIALSILPANDLWSVKVDPGKLAQVVMNLAVNARDAMPEGGELTIETQNFLLDDDYAEAHHDMLAGSYVMLAVSDTGIGMDEQTRLRIFEPFFTTKERGKGTGLGLATVFGIVKQSGGHIWVYSELGRGTTFKVYLPRVDGIAPARAPELPAAAIEGGTETILLVEDDDQVRAIAQDVLRRRGYVVLVAPNGGEGLLICEKHGARIHLLLTDVILPRMSGRELAERLAPLRPEMKVLYMSGYTDDTVLQHGILDSGVAFLQKPFTPTTLARKVRAVLDAVKGER